jgi:hypothetical protein
MLFYIGSDPKLPYLTFVGKKLYLDDNWSYIPIGDTPLWFTNNLSANEAEKVYMGSELDKTYIVISRDKDNKYEIYHSKDCIISSNAENITNII